MRLISCASSPSANEGERHKRTSVTLFDTRDLSLSVKETYGLLTRTPCALSRVRLRLRRTKANGTRDALAP